MPCTYNQTFEHQITRFVPGVILDQSLLLQDELFDLIKNFTIGDVK